MTDKGIRTKNNINDEFLSDPLARVVPGAPVAKKVPTERVFHGDTVVDEYEWLRDKESAEVLDHLKAENEYLQKVIAPLEPLKDKIYEEIKQRTKEDDTSVPVRKKDWWYWSATREGEQYPTHFRCPAVAGSSERPVPATTLEEAPAGTQVVLDCNKLAEGKEFFSALPLSISPNQELLAVGIDFTGDEHYQLYVYNIATGELVEREVDNLVDRPVWDVNSEYLFFPVPNEAWRPYQVWRHRLGTSQSEDVIVFQEDDEKFTIEVEVSSLNDWIIIGSGSKLTSECYLLNAREPISDLVVVYPREQGIFYSVEVAKDHLLVVHNKNLIDFEIGVAPIGSSTPEQWQRVLASEPGERIIYAQPFEKGLLVSMRSNALPAVKVLPRLQKEADLNKATEIYGQPWIVEGENLSSVYAGANPSWEQTKFLVNSESMVVPDTVLEYDFDTRTSVLVKQLEVPGVNLEDYITWREWAVAPDGTKVPVTLARHRSVEPGNNPGFIYGYGSYEIPTDPRFVVSWISLLDRGVVCALAHIRGGGEIGRTWYDNGKLLNKINTFTDFIAAADLLFETGWVQRGRLIAEGGSAGGLLMGAVANMGTDRFRAIHAAVPFVDALTTILDPSLPLTAGEWEEWGNPVDDPEVYKYMKSYTPYENVQKKQYPAILASTSLNDIRVLYVEPAKWVARLRDTVTNSEDRPIVMRCELVAGHGGPSGRYNYWKNRAESFAFLLDQVGVTE